MYGGYLGTFLYAFMPIGIMPVDELYAWSNNEKIHILFHKINEIIKATNDYDKLFMEVKDILDGIDDEIKDKVVEILTEWYEDGKLKDILEEIVAEYFDDINGRLETLESDTSLLKGKSSIIDFERCFRVLRQTAHYMYTQPSITTAADDTRTEHFSFLQGATNFWINNIDYMAMFYIPNDGTKFCTYNRNGVSYAGSGYTGNAYLEIRRRDGTFVKGIQINGYAGHAQAIAYHKGYLYFEGNNPLDVNAGRKLRRISFNFENDATVESYLMPFNFNGLSSYGDTLYATSAGENEIDVWKIEMQDDGVTPTGNVTNQVVMSPAYIGHMGSWNVRSETTFSGGFSVTNKYFYFGIHKPSGILRCKRNFDERGNDLNFTADWFYSIPYMLNDQQFKTGEIEGIRVYDDGTCFLFTTQHLFTKAINPRDITQVFRQNLYTNLSLPLVRENPHTGRQNIYVLGNYDNVRQVMNPDGTKDYPFNGIDEAVWWFNNTPKYSYGHFYFDGNSPYVAFCVSSKTYYFDAIDSFNQHYNITDEDNNPITQTGNIVSFGANITLQNIAARSTIHYLANSDPSATTQENMNAYSNQKQNPIYAYDSRIIILNSGASKSNNPNVVGGIYVGQSVGVYNCNKTYIATNFGETYWNNIGTYVLRLATSNFNVSKDLHENSSLSDANGYNFAT